MSATAPGAGTASADAPGPAAATPGCVNLLPGPVPIHPTTAVALARPATSHRDACFAADLSRIRARLCRLVGAAEVQVLTGSGTVANDAVAAQLSLRGERGLVVHSGEFGERLVDHCRRFRLAVTTFESRWGRDLPYDELAAVLGADPSLRWLWATHCETSSGVLHDLRRLVDLCAQRGVALVLDCVSSVGASAVDLDGVALASASSGKALASFAGLGLVFHAAPVAPSAAIPRCLDLGAYAAGGGIAFTTSTNLIYALEAALLRFGADVGLPGEEGLSWGDATPLAQRQAWRRQQAGELRSALRARGLELVADDPCAAPAVTAVRLPAGVSSVAAGESLQRHGFLVSYRSAYLVRQNIVQICLMGERPPQRLDEIAERLAALS